MANDLSQNAERTGASLEEVTFFHALAERWTPLSDEIKEVRFRFGEDSDGDAAVWISVIVDKDLRPSKEKISELQRIIESFKKDIFESTTIRWPYIEIEN